MISTKYKDQIQTIETVLLQFPEEYSKNFFHNLSTLIIKTDNSSLNVLGNYEPLTNVITLYDDSALGHELFHMAFNNRENYGIEVDKGLFIDNGISLRYGDNIFGHSLTEGFVEYLNRKCGFSKGRYFEYYFADLLISIYGEEILGYALKNNPVDFLKYDKFNNIKKYISELDYLEELFNNICFVVAGESLIRNAIIKNDIIILNDFKELILRTKTGISIAILNLFKIIIEEYNSCENPKISKEKLLQKIEEFCTDKEYSSVFRISFDNHLKGNILNLKVKLKYENKFICKMKNAINNKLNKVRNR